MESVLLFLRRRLFLFCLIAASFHNVEAGSIECGDTDSTVLVLPLMSYNVRNCIGMDNFVDYQRVADIIIQSKAEVIALQELDSVTQRSKGVDVLQEIAARCSMHHIFSKAIDFQNGKYGIGLLFRDQPLSVVHLPLPGIEEPRTFLLVEFQDYYIGCTHFSTTQTDQLLSVQIILDYIRDIEKPLFLLGDMNSEYDSPTQVTLRKKFIQLNDSSQKTFPADDPVECIDYLYMYNNNQSYTITESKVLNEPMASDHRPVYVKIRLQKE